MEEIITIIYGGVSYNAYLKRARKSHICRECGKEIRRGEYYYRYDIWAECCLCVDCALRFRDTVGVSRLTEELIRL